MHILDFVEEKKPWVFENVEMSNQRLKCLFPSNLLAWVGIYIREVQSLILILSIN